MDKNPQGLRKGTWTFEEDTLLRKCIEQYGEEKWHLVPRRAGLMRCRKSCRLRWMNYLKPDIKRGQFTEDEVDLIVRLHNLLGNRWTLIAGRIPGRTANDVKNFWFTYIGKKPNNIGMLHKIKSDNKGFNNYDNNVVKPRPLNLPKLSRIKGDLKDNEIFKNKETSKFIQERDEERVRYWSRLLETNDDHISLQHSQGLAGIAVGCSNDEDQNNIFRQEDDILGLGFDNVDMVSEFLNIEDL